MAVRNWSAFLWRAISLHKGTLILYLISTEENNGYQWYLTKYSQCREKKAEVQKLTEDLCFLLILLCKKKLKKSVFSIVFISVTNSNHIPISMCKIKQFDVK